MLTKYNVNDILKIQAKGRPMLKKLIEKLKQRKEEKEAIKLEKIMNKPEFRLCDLHVGEIVLYKKRKDIGLGKIDHYYEEVKNLHFFMKLDTINIVILYLVRNYMNLVTIIQLLAIMLFIILKNLKKHFLYI